MNVPKRRKMMVFGGVLALGVLGAGGYAVASGGDDEDGGRERKLTGQIEKQAVAAALKEVPGKAVATEYDTEDGATYEVEVKKDNGKAVDVRLDENFKVIKTEGDSENEDE